MVTNHPHYIKVKAATLGEHLPNHTYFNISYTYGLSDLIFYKKGFDAPIEIHYIANYLGKSTTLEKLVIHFTKEIAFYDIIVLSYHTGIHFKWFVYDKDNFTWYHLII